MLDGVHIPTVVLSAVVAVVILLVILPFVKKVL